MMEVALGSGPKLCGVFIAVVGPSGAGKDSVLDYVRNKSSAAENVHFARRIVTRPSLESAEDHDMLDEAEFATALEKGAFSLHWRAHGLCYALDRSVDDMIANGGIVIANLSRAVLGEVRKKYTNMLVVHITARPEVLAERLAKRGRENAKEIEARLQRSQCFSVAGDVTQIDNSGPLELAGQRFIDLLENQIPLIFSAPRGSFC